MTAIPGGGNELCERFVDEDGVVHEKTWDGVTLTKNEQGAFDENIHFHEFLVGAKTNAVSKRRLSGTLVCRDGILYEESFDSAGKKKSRRVLGDLKNPLG